MLRYNIIQLKASASGRPEGYVQFVLEHGRIEGDFVFLNETTQQELSQKFLPEKFKIVQLNANAEQLPNGFVDFILARGKIKDGFVEMDLDALDDG
jgi:hypothetical protein